MALDNLITAYYALADMAALLGIKAVRRPPKDPLNPSGRLLRGLEKNGSAKIAKMLEELGEDLFKGLTEQQVNLVFTRLNDDVTQDNIRRVLADVLDDIVVAGAEFGASQVLSLAGDISVDWQMANLDASRWAQEYSYELVKDITDATRDKLQKEIASFVENQGTLGELRESLTPTFGPVRADMIATTETTRAFAEGNQRAWKESGFVEGREWRTNNDAIVADCPICFPMNHVSTGIDEPFTHPTLGAILIPGHPRCRCWQVPKVTI